VCVCVCVCVCVWWVPLCRLNREALEATNKAHAAKANGVMDKVQKKLAKKEEMIRRVRMSVSFCVYESWMDPGCQCHRGSG
jgi:hypothetical protein